MTAAPRRLSRYELIDERQYAPRLQLAPELQVPPQQDGGSERHQAGQAWQALRAAPEDLIQDRLQLDRLDRGIVASRKQVHAARAEAQSARAQLGQVQESHFSAPVVYGLGAVAFAAAFGWLHQRRKLAELRAAQPPSTLTPVTFPAAGLPSGGSTFDGSDLNVVGDEADQWIAQAKVALPQGR